MFIAELKYLAPITEIDAHLVSHRSWLDTQYQAGHILFSGPQKPRTGGIVIAIMESKEKLEQLLAQDPFVQNKLAAYHITEFQAIKASSQLQQFLEV